MALRDHFRPPLSVLRHWHAFHNGWASSLAADLNALLPEGFFAEPNVQFGIEIDVATFEGPGERARATPLSLTESSREAAFGWSPPAPAMTVPFPLVGDVVEVLVYETQAGPVLTGAIELVSPSNKDRPSARAAFVAKCETYLQQGLGLIVVDIVTNRNANLHDDLMARLPDAQAARLGAELYAVAYHPVDRQGELGLDLWPESLAIGGSLPKLPLWLRGAGSVPVDLNASYERTCREQRIPPLAS